MPQSSLIIDSLSQKATVDTSNSLLYHVFQQHDLAIMHAEPIVRVDNTLLWTPFVLFLLFASFVYLYVSEPKKLFRVIMAAYNFQAIKQLEREDYKPNKRIYIFLSVSFLFSLAFLLYKLNDYFNFLFNDLSRITQFLLFFIIVACTYSVKLISTEFIGYVLNQATLTKEYVFSTVLFSQLTGLFIFPLLVLLEFSKINPEFFVYPSLIVLLVFYALRLVRGFFVAGIEHRVGILHLFIYLCALELLPLLVLIKFLWINFS